MTPTIVKPHLNRRDFLIHDASRECVLRKTREVEREKLQ
jgi:hypothetical protein